MEETLEEITIFIEQSGWMAPLIFIVLHVLRQVLFIPVLLMCLLGGYLFGTVYGSLYSLIGLTIASLVFRDLIQLFPGMKQKLTKLKNRLMKKDYNISIAQMMIMRLMPFIHFHFVSLYLIETTINRKSYLQKSILVSAPPAIMYTAIGDVIQELPLVGTIIFVSILTLLFLFLGNKNINNHRKKIEL